MKTVGEDVLASLNAATGARIALDQGAKDLRDAVAAKDWDRVEVIRERMLASVDSFVDNYAAAGKRLSLELADAK